MLSAVTGSSAEVLEFQVSWSRGEVLCGEQVSQVICVDISGLCVS